MTRLGHLVADLLSGRTVECSRSESERMSRDFAGARPVRYVRAISAAGDRFRVTLIGRPF